MDAVRTQPENAVEIRVAKREDAPQIAACMEAAFAPYRDFYTPDAYADTVPSIDGILGRLSNMRVLVAVQGNQVAGTIAGELNERGEGHLRGMAVLMQWQGSGVAARLLVSIEDYLRSQSCSRVTLDTTLPLQRAIRFYQGHGYRHSGMIGDFFGMPLYEYAKDL